MIEQVLVSIVSGGLSAALVLLILREWLSERLKQSISNEYARRLEEHKREVEFRFNDRVRLRKLYEELSMSLEDLYGTMPSQTPRDLGIAIHKIFALLALYAPDDVYRHVKETFYSAQGKTVYAKDFRPAVYHALRKSVLGEETHLAPGDIVDNIDVTPLPQQVRQ